VQQLSQALRERSLQADVHAQVARTDELTGLPNRRAFHEELARRLTDHRLHGQPLTVLLLDVDGFKRINDSLGHAAGDQALRETAACLRKITRKRDVAARLGGDEFAMIFPKTTLADARTAAERLRSCVAELRLGEEPLPVTVSGGLAAACDSENAEQLLRRADAALYDAKRSGRNCVCWRESHADPVVQVSGGAAERA
jgi:diguanylate cyclase (GGDEF)-like protein